MGSTKVSAPAPPAKSAAQMEIEQEQLEILREQRQQQSEFQPFLYKSMGLTRDPESGELVETPVEKTELERLYEERQLAALKGDLPVSPALEAELQTQQGQISEDLARRLGPQYQQTTAGQQSMGEFQKRAGLLREEARRGQLTTGEGLLASRTGQISDIEQRRFANLQGAGQPGLQLLGAYGGVLSPYQSERMMGWQMQNQAAQQSAANRAGMISSAFGAAGTAAGVGIGLCWVADVLFGATHPKTHYARFYASNTDNWFTRLYRKHGKGWAAWLEKHPNLQFIVKPIWQWMAYKGEKMMEEKLCQSHLQIQ